MGITYLDAAAYCAARSRGVSFGRTITLGRQKLYLHRQEVHALQRRYRAENGRWPESLADYSWGDFADAFLLEYLGVSDLDVLDASPYEGATTIHDMNEPVPSDWKGKYDSVIDCGSIEHIFNVPTVLRNLASMVVLGGSLFITTPANNLMGHGFYQFSPELMYRVFCQRNGFAIKRMTLRESAFPQIELTRVRRQYAVADPADIHKRVGLVSKRPTMMFVETVKIAEVDMLAQYPQQSDYVAAWTAGDVETPDKSFPKRVALRVLDVLPPSVSAQFLGRRERRRYSLKNREFFNDLGD